MDNDEVVENDVPETSDESLEGVQVDTSQNEEQEQANSEEIERLAEERANQLFEEKVEERLIRDRNKREKEQNKKMAKYKQLENVVKAGMGVDSLDEAITRSTQYYKDAGIEIPEYKNEYTTQEQNILGKADAEEIIELGKDEMEAEANRLAQIPYEQKSIRERKEFEVICTKLTELKDIDELKNNGADSSILSNNEFVEFRKQFNNNVPIKTVYDMYKKINTPAKTKPASPGSASTSASTNHIGDYISSKDFDSLTDEQLNDPKIMAIVDKSRTKWLNEN